METVDQLAGPVITFLGLAGIVMSMLGLAGVFQGREKRD